MLLVEGARIIVHVDELAQGRQHGTLRAADEAAAAEVEAKQERLCGDEERQRIEAERQAEQTRAFRAEVAQRAAEAMRRRQALAAHEAERLQHLADEAKARATGQPYQRPVKGPPPASELVEVVAIVGFRHECPTTGRGVPVGPGERIKILSNNFADMKTRGLILEVGAWEAALVADEQRRADEAPQREALLTEHLGRAPTALELQQWAHIELAAMPEILLQQKASMAEWIAAKDSRAAEVEVQERRGALKRAPHVLGGRGDQAHEATAPRRAPGRRVIARTERASRVRRSVRKPRSPRAAKPGGSFLTPATGVAVPTTRRRGPLEVTRPSGRPAGPGEPP